MVRQYKTIQGIKDAFECGELDPEENRLVIDNDTCFIYDEGEKIFEGSPREMFTAMLDELGIPWEHC